jgi:hypothetical protein
MLTNWMKLRSSSMGYTDRRPLSNTPVTARISSRHNNRVGAVYSSLYAFWNARHGTAAGTINRRDAYSVILFDNSVDTILTNNFASSPDDLLNQVLQHGARGGTNYSIALQAAQSCMEMYWSTER